MWSLMRIPSLLLKGLVIMSYQTLNLRLFSSLQVGIPIISSRITSFPTQTNLDSRSTEVPTAINPTMTVSSLLSSTDQLDETSIIRTNTQNMQARADLRLQTHGSHCC